MDISEKMEENEPVNAKDIHSTRDHMVSCLVVLSQVCSQHSHVIEYVCFAVVLSFSPSPAEIVLCLLEVRKRCT